MKFEISSSHLDCQHNRDIHYDQAKDEDEDEDCIDNNAGARAVVPDSASESSHRSSLGNDADFAPKSRRQTAKQKLWQLQELVAMVQVKWTTVLLLECFPVLGLFNIFSFHYSKENAWLQSDACLLSVRTTKRLL